MKDRLLIILAIIILFIVIVSVFFLEHDINSFILNLLYAFISSLLGAFVVLSFLDRHYQLKADIELKTFMQKLKLKLYSSFLLMESPIKTFLKCDPNLKASMSIKIGRIHSERGDVFEDVTEIEKMINDLINTINKQKELEYFQEKRFDYCACYIRMYKRIKLNIDQILEMSILIPPNNIRIKELFLRILFIKQNLDRFNEIINQHIDIKKYSEYTSEAKSNVVATLELVNDIGCFSIVKLILKNLEDLFLTLREVCSDPEIKKYSETINKLYS